MVQDKSKGDLEAAARLYNEYKADPEKKPEAATVVPAKVFLTSEYQELGFKPKMTRTEYKDAIDRAVEKLELLGKSAFLVTVADEAEDLQRQVQRDGVKLKDEEGRPTAVAHRIEELNTKIKKALRDPDILKESGITDRKISESEIAALQEVIAFGSIEEGERLHKLPKHGLKGHQEKMKAALASDKPSRDEGRDEGPADVGIDDVNPQTLPLSGGQGPAPKGPASGGARRKAARAA